MRFGIAVFSFIYMLTVGVAQAQYVPMPRADYPELGPYVSIGPDHVFDIDEVANYEGGLLDGLVVKLDYDEFPDDDDEIGLSGAVGTLFRLGGQTFGVEAELGSPFLSNEFFLAMANAAYYAPVDLWQIRPFFGAGIGAAFLDSETTLLSGGGFVTIDERYTTFAYQFQGGLEVMLTNDMALRLAYRRIYTDNFTTVFSPDERRQSDLQLNSTTVRLVFFF